MRAVLTELKVESTVDTSIIYEKTCIVGMEEENEGIIYRTSSDTKSSSG